MVLSMDRWVGKVAVVTGASSGIGAAVAESLVKQGLRVVGLARRKERVDALAKKLSGKKGILYAVKADLSQETDILRAFRWIKNNVGPVHILINNAGVAKNDSLSEGTTENWENILRVNVIGLSIATREAIRDMKANKVDGHIIHINSIAGNEVINLPGLNIYPGSKFAVRALAETLRLELNSSKSKIKITNLSPGGVLTEMVNQPTTEEQRKVIDTLIKDKQILDPDDIAASVNYVLSTPPHVQVVGLARRKDKMEDLAKKLSGKKGKLYPPKTDVSEEEDILAAFKWIKDNVEPAHILINNARVIKRYSLLGANTQYWETVLRINVIGLSIATREAIRDMKENNVDGHIIHTNSVMGNQVVNFPGLSIYPASKFAIKALAETLRLERNSSKSKIKITVCDCIVNSRRFNIKFIEEEEGSRRCIKIKTYFGFLRFNRRCHICPVNTTISRRVFVKR